MEHPCPIEALPEAAHKPLRGPAPMRMMVARGMAPLPPLVMVSVLYALAYDANAALSATARGTLEKLPPAMLDPALANPGLPAAVLDDLALRLARNDVFERVVQHPNVLPETVARIAESADENLCELIATNEQRLIGFPAVIEALYYNRALRMSTADRIVELAARNGVELSIPGYRAIVLSLQHQLIPEAGELTPADEMFRAAMGEAAALEDSDEDVVERDEEKGTEELKDKFKKVDKALSDMSISEKIRTALIGTPSQRLILVRSGNRVVAHAAISSPKIQESEAVKISASRSVGEDVLRFIATKRDWVRLHQIKVNLCFNPKTPIATSLRLLPHLREVDLKQIQRSKNVPQALKTAVSQLNSKRENKG